MRFKGSNRIYKIFERSDTRIGTITVSKDECNRYFVPLQICKKLPKDSIYSGIFLGIPKDKIKKTYFIKKEVLV